LKLFRGRAFEEVAIRNQEVLPLDNPSRISLALLLSKLLFLLFQVH
jgi:hypothetical protein